MNPVSLTLTFDSLHEAQAALAAMAGADSRQAKIDANDRPDTGVSAALPVAPLFNPFAASAAVAQVPPPPAPSTAAAEAPPTVPAVPPATSVTPLAAGVPPVPPSAPAAAVPAAPAAPASPAGIEVDADGLPWDARIHAGGRAKNADGRWRQKRGLNDAALKSRVEAELRQAMGAAGVALGGPNAPAAPVPSVPVPLPLAAPEAATTSAVPVPPPITVPSPAAPSAPTAEEPAPQFLARVGGMLASGALTQERLAAVLGTVGLSTMAQLIVAPALIPAVRAQIDAE